MDYLKLIDLPEHEKINKLVGFHEKFTFLLIAACASLALAALVRLYYSDDVALMSLISLPIGIGLFYTNQFAKYREDELKAIFIFAGLMIGSIYTGYKNNESLLEVLMWGTGGGVAGAIAGVITAAVIYFFLNLFLGVATIVGLVTSFPILVITSIYINHKLKKTHQLWSKVVKLDIFGEWKVLNSEYSVFVAKPEMRRNGRAREYGIPTFLASELKPDIIKQRIAEANARAANSEQPITIMDSSEFANIFNSLEMHQNSANMIHDGQNFGQSINPATGLPTIAGHGSPDVAGNNWGETHH